MEEMIGRTYRLLHLVTYNNDNDNDNDDDNDNLIYNVNTRQCRENLESGEIFLIVCASCFLHFKTVNCKLHHCLESLL